MRTNRTWSSSIPAHQGSTVSAASPIRPVCHAPALPLTLRYSACDDSQVSRVYPTSAARHLPLPTRQRLADRRCRPPLGWARRDRCPGRIGCVEPRRGHEFPAVLVYTCMYNVATVWSQRTPATRRWADVHIALANRNASSQPPNRTQTNGGPSPSSRSLSSGITHFVSSLRVSYFAPE